MGRSDDRSSRSRRSRSRSPNKRSSTSRRRSRSPHSRDHKSSSSSSRRSARAQEKGENTSVLGSGNGRDAPTIDYAQVIAMEDSSAAQKQLAEEMARRRERIHRMREEKRRQDVIDQFEDNHKKEKSVKGLKENSDDETEDAKPMVKKTKKWNLDDDFGGGDDEEDAPPKPSVDGDVTKMEVEDEEVDPLDAFMVDVDQQVKELKNAKVMAKKQDQRGHHMNKGTGKKTKFMVVSREDKATAGPEGYIVEQNADSDVFEAAGDSYGGLSGRLSLETKGKNLAVTDHSKVYYRPFRRDFYVEVPELSNMTKAEVDVYRKSMEGIKVRGKRAPKPIKAWVHAGVSTAVLTTLKILNYKTPTPIQAQAIPSIMSGRDVLAVAKTGSGKTLAFLLPMFRHIMDQEPLDDMDGPIAMVITPTRELATQIASETRKFCRAIGIRAVAVYGGAPITEQINELKRGVEIIISTPGRLIDLLAANNGKVTNLRRVTYLVLDEADRMFDAGFEPQITRILANIRPERQTVMFSATFPRSMEALARKTLNKPIEIQVGNRATVCDDVDQNVVVISEADKFSKLLELLGVYWEYGSVLIFTDKQEHCAWLPDCQGGVYGIGDDLVLDLMRAGYNECAPLHAGVDQYDRDTTIVDYKIGKIKMLVATGVAARGLDVKKLVLVINYDCPNHYEEYVHRVGRTGRAGAKGYAYTFILPHGQEKYAGDLVNALEQSETDVPEDLMDMWKKFKSKEKQAGREVKLGGGFGGTGYKFDGAEQDADDSKKRLEKLSRGGIDADDDNEIEREINKVMKSKKRVKKTPNDGPAKANQGALEKAREMAARIAATKAITMPEKSATQLTAENLMKTDTSKHSIEGPEISAEGLAKQLASKLNEKLNYVPEDRPKEEEKSQWKIYEEELEINEFPQAVRYRLCSREVMNEIQEDNEVGMSVKGEFFPPRHEPKGIGERKLYIFLEATNEMSLARAKSEIMRITKEMFAQSAEQIQRSGATGRYTVI